MGTKDELEFDGLPAGVIVESDDDAAGNGGDEAGTRLLGELLIRDGRITPWQLDAALAKQRADWSNGQNSFLGQILVEMEAIRQSDLICALMKQTHLPYLHLPSYEVDPEAAKLVPEAVCRRHLLLPIDKLGRILTVAMVSPLNDEAFEAVKQACPDLHVKRIVCGWPDLQEAFSRLFSRVEPMPFDLKARLAKH